MLCARGQLSDVVTGSERLAEAFVEVEQLLRVRSTPALELKKSLELKEVLEVPAPRVPLAPKAVSGVSKVRSLPQLRQVRVSGWGEAVVVVQVAMKRDRGGQEAVKAVCLGLAYARP